MNAVRRLCLFAGIVVLGTSALFYYAARRGLEQARVWVEQRLANSGYPASIDRISVSFWSGEIRLHDILLGDIEADNTKLVRVGQLAVRPAFKTLLLQHHLRLVYAIASDVDINLEALQHYQSQQLAAANQNDREENDSGVLLQRIVGAAFDIQRLTLHAPSHSIDIKVPQLFVMLLAPDNGQDLPLAQGHVVLSGGGRMGLRAEARTGDMHLGVDFDGVSLADAPFLADLRGVRYIKSGFIAGDIDVTWSNTLGRLDASVDLNIDNVVVEHPRLAAEPVGPMYAMVSTDLTWENATKRIKTKHGLFTLGPQSELEAQFYADVSFAQRGHIAAGIDVKDTDARAALEALPATLQPGERAPRLAGALSASLHITGLTAEPDDWQIVADCDLQKLQAVQAEANSKGDASGDAAYLRRPFVFRFVDPQGRQRSVLVGLNNPDFVPLHDLPAYVVRAVTTSEDGGFFAHHGFDFAEIKNSALAVIAAGHAVRGGSTITQQLAKNLFLSRDKTYARKVREALITLALEASVPKWRILEIYLNIIEWGPGLYGIGPAAERYFGKDARALSVKEAAFLASIIPNPVKYSMYQRRGSLTEAWNHRVEDILWKMSRQGVVSEEERAEASSSPLIFKRPGT